MELRLRFLLENKNKIGYIYLPSFYTDFTRNGARHCSQDMRKEIEKLKIEVEETENGTHFIYKSTRTAWHKIVMEVQTELKMTFNWVAAVKPETNKLNRHKLNQIKTNK